MDFGKIFGKIPLPAAIILSAAILGIAFYAVQNNKQQSLERQQIREQEQKKISDEAKEKQIQKEYAADRKLDCLKIYSTESDKWNNVLGWRYTEDTDECFITYRSPKQKSDAECDKEYPVGKDGDLDWGYLFMHENVLCKDGKFENSF